MIKFKDHHRFQAILLRIYVISFLMMACGTGIDQNDKKSAKYHHRLAYGHFFENGDSDAALQEAVDCESR